jgi:peptidoglycan lytic transglycosylase
MKELIMGCAVAAVMALSAPSEARQPQHVILPVPIAQSHEAVQGLASWYGKEFQGTLTASGQPFDMNGLTAAQWDVPLGTRIRVINLSNKKSIVLRVNDRGPNRALKHRVVDVSKAAAVRLGFLEAGLTPVRVEVLTNPHTN